MQISGTIRLNTPATFSNKNSGWIDIRDSVLQCRLNDADKPIWEQGYHGYAFEITNLDTGTWALIRQPNGDWGKYYPHSLVTFPSKVWFDEWLKGFPEDMRPTVIACGHAADDPDVEPEAPAAGDGEQGGAE
jgi:hypothetical protein